MGVCGRKVCECCTDNNDDSWDDTGFCLGVSGWLLRPAEAYGCGLLLIGGI